MIDYDKLRKELVEDEGYRSHPYKDTVGKITIGIGHNLSDNGLPKAVIETLYQMHIRMIEEELAEYLPWQLTQPEPVRRALFNLCFNMGINRLLKFTTTLALIENRRYFLAIEALKKSKWYKQVQKSRSERIFNLLREGMNVENP